MPSNTHVENLKRLERAAFKQFAACAKLRVVPGSLQQPRDPEPDILVEIVDSGPVAFELGRLNAPLESHRIALMDSGGQRFEEEVGRRSVGEQDQIAAFLADAQVILSPRAGYPDRELRLAARWVVDQLLSLPEGFEGPLEVSNAEGRAVLAAVEVIRAELPDVSRFSVMTADYARRADLGVLERKLKTRYVSSSAPIELLAYVDRSEFSFRGEIESATAIIEKLAPASVFRAVWLFEGLLSRATLAFRRDTLR
jgi:hypothetical protein